MSIGYRTLIIKDMKMKYFGCLFVLLCVFIGCEQEKRFVISGEVKEADGVEIRLVARNDVGGWDTLSRTTVENGKFLLKGMVERPLIALVDGGRDFRAVPVFVENVDYQVWIDRDKPMKSKVEGGRLQQLSNDYNRGRDSLRERMEVVRDTFRLARREGDQETCALASREFERLDSVRKDMEVRFLREHGESLPALYALYKHNDRLPFERFRLLYGSLTEEVKNTPYGKIVSERYRKAKITSVGEVAPNFLLQTPAGDTLSLYGIKAKVKIVDFWASWCAPCRVENPHMVELYKKYRAYGLDIVGVSLDVKKEAWVKAIEDDGLGWNHVSDLKGWNSMAAQLYDIHEVPSVFVLDEDNVIVGSYVRGERLEACVRESLGMEN